MRRTSSADETFVAKGVTGQLIVTPTKVVIHRRGFTGFVLQQGDKEIRIDQITAIQIKKPGLSNGFIRLSFTGGQEYKRGGTYTAVNDENAIVFRPGQTSTFLHAKELIETYQAMYRQQNVVGGAAPSSADELAKLAALKDRGILTQAEFDAKKKQILGL